MHYLENEKDQELSGKIFLGTIRFCISNTTTKSLILRANPSIFHVQMDNQTFQFWTEYIDYKEIYGTTNVDVYWGSNTEKPSSAQK